MKVLSIVVLSILFAILMYSFLAGNTVVVFASAVGVLMQSGLAIKVCKFDTQIDEIFKLSNSIKSENIKP